MFKNDPAYPETNSLTAHSVASSSSLLLKHWQESNATDSEAWPQALASALNMILPAPFPMAIFWSDDHKVFFNDAFGRLLAAESTYSCFQGSTGLDFWPEAWTAVKPLIEKVRKTGVPCSGKDQPIQSRRNGIAETILLTYSLSPVWDANSQPSGVLLTCHNTTSACQKIAKLEEKVSRYHHLIMHAPVAIAIFRSPELVADTANEACLAIIGKTKAEFIGKPLFEAIPEIKDTVQPVMDEVIRTGVSYHKKEHGIVVNRNGIDEPGYFDFTCEPLHDDNGFVEGVMVYANEVTAQVNARRKLRETKELLELTVEKVPASIYLFDAQGKLLLSNDKAGQEISSFISDNLPPEINIKALRQAIMDLMVLHKEDGSDLPASEFPVDISFDKGKAAEMITRCTNRKTGAINWSLIKSTPLFGESGNVNMVLVAKTDITRQKIADEKIRESEVGFRSIFENAAVGIAQVAPDGGLLLVNQRFCDIVGYTKEELEENSFQNITYPDDLNADLTLVQQLLKGLSNTYTLEKRYIHKNGSIVWVNLTVALVRNEQGQPQYFVSVIEDTTIRKKAEAHLKESEEQLRIALEGGELGYFDFDLITSKLYWSARTKELFGLDQDIEATYAHFLKALHPEDRIFLELPLKEELFIQNEGKYEQEYRILSLNDGKLRWIRSTGKYFFDQKGKPYRLSGVVQDITEQKRSEALIRESEERFRKLADHAPMWVWLMDEQVNLTYANKRMLQYVSRSHTVKLSGTEWEQFVYPEDVSLIYQEVAAAVQNEKPCALEVRILNTRTGVYEWFYLKVAPRFEDNNLVGFIGTGNNIQEKRMQLEALKQSEEQFRTLAESLPQLIWIADADSNPLYTSCRWEQYTGTCNIGIEAWSQIVHPDDWASIKEGWSKSIESKVIFQPEIRLRHKSGVYRWNKAHYEPIKNGDGKVVKWIGAFTDIHDQKTFSEKLEQLVDQRTLELQRSNEDLQQFAHVASHDLKEPVRKIKTFISRFESVLEAELSTEGKRYLDKIQNAANRMMVMIDGVLNYSTLNATEQEYEPVDLADIIHQIESDLELVIQQKGAWIHIHDLPVITAAPVLIYQMFYNLIFNSLKFARHHVAPVIVLSSEEFTKGGKTFFRIKVSDNGIGFDQQYADQIFSTFTRLNSKDKYEGTGLGLALCKKIVERHGGTITATGVKDAGAAFYIELPAAGNGSLLG